MRQVQPPMQDTRPAKGQARKGQTIAGWGNASTPCDSSLWIDTATSRSAVSASPEEGLILRACLEERCTHLQERYTHLQERYTHLATGEPRNRTLRAPASSLATSLALPCHGETRNPVVGPGSVVVSSTAPVQSPSVFFFCWGAEISPRQAFRQDYSTLCKVCQQDASGPDTVSVARLERQIPHCRVRACGGVDRGKGCQTREGRIRKPLSPGQAQPEDKGRRKSRRE